MKALAWALPWLLAAAPAGAVKVERMMGVLSRGRAVEAVSGEVLVQFSSAAAAAQRDAAISGAGLRLIGELPFGWTVVGLPPGTAVAAGMRLVRSLPGVVSYHPNHVYRANRVPNDPLVPSQYALSQINAFAGWEYETGASNQVTIAVIDGGIDGAHPDLSAKLVSSGGVQSQSFDPNLSTSPAVVNDPPTAACNHATRTSGVAAASTDNGLGLAGVSWGARLLSLKVFADADCDSACCSAAHDCSASGDTCGTTDAAMANAIAYAISRQNSAATGRIVINMSLGGAGGCPGVCPGADCVALTQTALSSAVAAGIPVVISAGNDGGPVNAPASCAGAAGGSGIIPVGATDSGNNIASFSSQGPELAANGVVAPGVHVETTDSGAGYTGGASGTSFSAPHVAGLAALILSAKPAFTPQQVQAAIQGGSDSVGAPAAQQGAGRIDVYRSLRLAVNGTLAGFEGDRKAIAFPNPFRTAQARTVSITIPTGLQGSSASIKIYTLSGELVRELDGLSWDGRNSRGSLVASGTYVFVLSTGKGTARGRLAVIR